MASSSPHSGLNRLTRCLVIVLFVFLSAQGLAGFGEFHDATATLQLTGSVRNSWMAVAGSPELRGGLLAVAGVVLVSIGVRTWRKFPSRHAHWCLVSAIALVVVEALLIFGSVPPSNLNPALTVLAAMLLFLFAVGFAVCTGKNWAAAGATKEDFQRPGVFAVGAFTTVAVLCHVVMSIGFGTGPFEGYARLACMITEASLMVSLVAMIFHRHPEIASLHVPASLMLLLLPVQIILGNWAYLLGREQPDHGLSMLHRQVIVGELQLLSGVLLGAIGLFVTLQARKHLTTRVIASPLHRGAAEA